MRSRPAAESPATFTTSREGVRTGPPTGRQQSRALASADRSSRARIHRDVCQLVVEKSAAVLPPGSPARDSPRRDRPIVFGDPARQPMLSATARGSRAPPQMFCSLRPAAPRANSVIEAPGVAVNEKTAHTSRTGTPSMPITDQGNQPQMIAATSHPPEDRYRETARIHRATTAGLPQRSGERTTHSGESRLPGTPRHAAGDHRRLVRHSRRRPKPARRGRAAGSFHGDRDGRAPPRPHGRRSVQARLT